MDPPEKKTFEAFVKKVNPSLLKYEHIPRLVRVGQRVADGELTRVIVCMPPQYFKTETFGRLLPAYFLREYGKVRAAVVSYGANLAWKTSEESRFYFQEDGGFLSHDTGAKQLWKTNTFGEMWAAGVGGGLLGHGYELGVVDDPTDPEKAHSLLFQKKFIEWWPAKFLSRQGPRARIVLVMQRLGTEDPIDYLFRREVGENTEKRPENWHIVICDEVKSNEPLGRWDGPRGLPDTCTIEPDEREEGQVLAPSYRDEREVIHLQNTAGSYVTSSQRQQRPMRPSGDYWRREWFRSYKTLPSDAHNGGKDWDTAYTKDEANAASAYVESYRGKSKSSYGEFDIYIEDIDWDWMEFPALIERMRSVNGPHYIEGKASGKSAKQALQAEGIVAYEVPVKGDKFARANAIQKTVANKRVWVNEKIIDQFLTGERLGLLRITAEALLEDKGGLDLNDAFVQAVSRHLNLYSYSFIMKSG